MAANRYITLSFPLENVQVYVEGTKVTALVKEALYKAWGRSFTREVYQAKHTVSSYNFDLIYHEGRALAVKAFPQMFHVWLTKKSSGCSGTNRQLSHIYLSGDF